MVSTRPDAIVISESRLQLPVYFPSISSLKTANSPLAYAQILKALASINSQFLISAYDIGCADEDTKSSFRSLIKDALAAGTTVLMDSGNYESYWRGAGASWDEGAFHSVLGALPFSFAFGFDEQNPPQNLDTHVGLVVERWNRDQVAAEKRAVIPIVHATPDVLPALCQRVVAATGVPMIAVPERRLGEGVFERAATVAQIRAALNESHEYTALHLLGTGNPISIAIYSIFGADSFDGLEWCQTVVDHETSLLFHLSQADFFRGQTHWGSEELSFQARTLAHNLHFYQDWVSRLRNALQRGEAIDFCRHNFPPRIYLQCSSAFQWG
jgi:hypothetical protein